MDRMPWVEKYRPRVLTDVVGNVAAVERLQSVGQLGNMPNLILSGPPGCGKTTCVQALARQLLGEKYGECVLELNASDDRGIDVVRNTVKLFAHKKVAGLPPGRHKIVILDEADSMTPGAQQALRRTMEVFASSTRFALACNNSSDIIEPLQSRCAIVRFARLADAEMLPRLRLIAEKEGVVVEDKAYEAMLFAAEGDMRHAINTLQAANAAFEGPVTAENVFKVADQPHPEIVRQALLLCTKSSFEKAQEIMGALVNQGYAPQDIMSTMFRVLKANPRGKDDLTERQKLDFMREIGLAHATTGADGLNTRLQLAGLIARLCMLSLPKDTVMKE